MSLTTDSHASPSHTAPPPETEERRPWTVLALMLAAQFMVVLDVSVVNVALPSIGPDLQLTSADYQWVVSAYVLLSGGFLLLGGRMADLLRRRGVFLAGLALFAFGSLASGLADSALALVLSRGAQGAGAAMLTPAAMSIVMTSYVGRQRAAALAAWGTVASMGIAAGVLFGGILTSAFDWRAVFFINVPIAVVVLLGTLRSVARGERAADVRRGLDLPGSMLLVTGLVTLVWSVEQSGRHGWDSARTLVGAGIALALLAAFALAERRVTAPIVPPATWRIRSLVTASTVMAGVTGAVVGAIFLSSLFLQQVVGSSAIVTGLQFLPLAVAITLSAAVASKLLPRTGPRLLIAVGLVVAATGGLVLSTLDGGASYVDVLPGFLVMGLGVGPMFVAISVAAMSDVPHEQSGLASGLMMTGHEVGAALGVAVLTVVGGDLTTRAGLVAGCPEAFLTITGLLLGLLLPTALMPRPSAESLQGAGHGHGHGHGH